jgi:hypothetical protein
VLIRTVLAGGLAIVLAAVAVLLSDRQPRMAGSNLVPDFGLLPELPAGKRLCQTEELVPAGAATVRVRIAASRAPGLLDLNVEAGGNRVTRGRVATTPGDQFLTVPIEPVARTTDGARLCITNRGASPVALAGSDRIQPPAKADGGSLPGRVRVDYFRPGRESWWALIGTVVHRFGYGRADLLGSWTLFLALGLTMCAIAVAAVAVLRPARS